MNVSPANAERANSRTQRRAVRLPLAQRRVDANRTVRKIDRRIRTLKHQTRWYLPVLERQDCLDKTCDTGSRIEMPDVGFQRADCTEPASLSGTSEGARERLDFNRIPNQRSGTMRFDVRDGLSLD